MHSLVTHLENREGTFEDKSRKVPTDGMRTETWVAVEGWHGESDGPASEAGLSCQCALGQGKEGVLAETRSQSWQLDVQQVGLGAREEWKSLGKSNPSGGGETKKEGTRTLVVPLRTHAETAPDAAW